ncbi:MAG: penicillin-binding protein [Planctomycetaceae bacterium]|nr:penicillin-binding protein [Planctomycetaceae bacterium]
MKPTSAPSRSFALRGLDDRTRTVVAVLGFVWLVLAARLVHLQWVNHRPLASQASEQRSFYQTRAAPPGEILDRTGRVALAMTITARSVFVDPSRVDDPLELAQKLGEALKLDAMPLAEKIAAHSDRQFVWIKRRITEQEEEAVRELGLSRVVCGLRNEYLRQYPMESLAAHIIGLRDIDGVGRGGVEQSLDAIIHGRPGRIRLVRDARYRIMEVHESVEQPPIPGQTVQLTIDVVVQSFVERELNRIVDKWAPKSATAIVMDPHNGDILAMSSRPTFDPNAPGNVDPKAWKNHAIASVYEPGSTFKPFVVGWALDNKVITTASRFDCENGRYRMGTRLLKDHGRHGVLNVTDILVKSSNIGMAKIGELLGNKELYRCVVHFGFGQPTGIELPGEINGLVRDYDKWDRYSTGSIPMGQEIAVTPLQLITAHAALANGGRLVCPRLVHEVTETRRLAEQHDEETQNKVLAINASIDASSSSIVSQTIDAEIADWIISEPMANVVTRGTGKSARLKEYKIYGKTGTAQKLDPATGKYSTKHHVCSFICGGPVPNPRALVLVLVDEPTKGTVHYGGTVAAPAASEILKKTLMHLGVAQNGQ